MMIDDDRDELAAHLVDDGTISAAAAAKERCRLRGICSEPDCDQPIDGWCDDCNAKLCSFHLACHDMLTKVLEPVRYERRERSGDDGG